MSVHITNSEVFIVKCEIVNVNIDFFYISHTTVGQVGKRKIWIIMQNHTFFRFFAKF